MNNNIKALSKKKYSYVCYLIRQNCNDAIISCLLRKVSIFIVQTASTIVGWSVYNISLNIYFRKTGFTTPVEFISFLVFMGVSFLAFYLKEYRMTSSCLYHYFLFKLWYPLELFLEKRPQVLWFLLFGIFLFIYNCVAPVYNFRRIIVVINCINRAESLLPIDLDAADSLDIFERVCCHAPWK